ncbi:MAG: YdbL family protein [Betaproteobacteria bacterium]|nr:YdbL family protein [Betaproteobacteria bacterium]
MRSWLTVLTWITCALAAGGLARAQANLEINTPAIASLKASMQQRHAQLAAFYASGAVGLTRDGLIALRDANAVPLAQRQQVNALIAAETQDRLALYREIARANGRPEWENDIRATFAQRWIEKAQPGWYYQSASGAWARK